jgi:putative effector of murein hydrolase LrgA (UPF0299 family)
MYFDGEDLRVRCFLICYLTLSFFVLSSQSLDEHLSNLQLDEGTIFIPCISELQVVVHYNVLHFAQGGFVVVVVVATFLSYICNWIKEQLCCSSARQSHAFDEGIVAWRVISKQILLRP